MKTRILPLFAAALLAGCGIFPDYYPDMEDRIEQHAQRTNEMVADGDAGRLSAAQSRAFVAQAHGLAQGLHGLARQSEGNSRRTAALETLVKQYETLLASGKPLRSSSAAPLQATLHELRSLQGFRRHLLKEDDVVRSSPTTESSTTSDDTSSKDDDSKKCKKHDRDDHCPKDRRH